jgi:hypothetical protein
MNKLPIGLLARHAYLDVLANQEGLLRVGGPWLLLSWALLLLAHSGVPLLSLAADLSVTVGAAAIAVTWHRHILEDEPLTAKFAPVDARVMRYFVLTVLLAFVVGVPPLLMLVLTGGAEILVGGGDGDTPTGGGLGMLLVPATMVACLYAAQRLQMLLPAAAIRDTGMTAARSWALTQGNGWRLLAGFALVTLPLAVLMIAITLFLGWASDATGSIVLAALADLVAVGNAWLQAPIIASFLAYAYLFLQKPSTEVARVTAQ